MSPEHLSLIHEGNQRCHSPESEQKVRVLPPYGVFSSLKPVGVVHPNDLFYVLCVNSTLKSFCYLCKNHTRTVIMYVV